MMGRLKPTCEKRSPVNKNDICHIGHFACITVIDEMDSMIFTSLLGESQRDVLQYS